jgi:hypothetical protein
LSSIANVSPQLEQAVETPGEEPGEALGVAGVCAVTFCPHFLQNAQLGSKVVLQFAQTAFGAADDDAIPVIELTADFNTPLTACIGVFPFCFTQYSAKTDNPMYNKSTSQAKPVNWNKSRWNISKDLNQNIKTIFATTPASATVPMISYDFLTHDRAIRAAGISNSIKIRGRD